MNPKSSADGDVKELARFLLNGLKPLEERQCLICKVKPPMIPSKGWSFLSLEITEGKEVWYELCEKCSDVEPTEEQLADAREAP